LAVSPCRIPDEANVTRTSSGDIIAVVGPTASGKSTLGIELALSLGGEVINCDSVQVYREVEIATAKVPFEERAGITHHLMDFVSPSETYTAGNWADDALEKIREIEARGRTAIIVGGTGFYLRALRNPFFPSPPTDPIVRDRVTRLRNERGTEYVHRLLSKLDPGTGARLYPSDWPRVQRALEVRLQTGKPISAQLSNRAVPPPEVKRIKVIALNPPRQELYRLINQRAQDHFDAGLVEEVRSLLNSGVPAGSNALGAHGYRRVVEYLHGKRSLQSAIEQTKQDVRNYAKRQITWFKREEGVKWFEGFGTDFTLRQCILDYLNIK
jgi:tRNA dimethylallyltransferase